MHLSLEDVDGFSRVEYDGVGSGFYIWIFHFDYYILYYKIHKTDFDFYRLLFHYYIFKIFINKRY